VERVIEGAIRDERRNTEDAIRRLRETSEAALREERERKSWTGWTLFMYVTGYILILNAISSP